MLHIQNGKCLASYMLILHFVFYLSGECSTKKTISFPLGYVSKSLIFVLCFSFFFVFWIFVFVFVCHAKGDNSSKAYQCLGDQEIGRTIWSYGGRFGKVLSFWLSDTLLGRLYLELKRSFHKISVRKQFILVLESKLLNFTFLFPFSLHKNNCHSII